MPSDSAFATSKTISLFGTQRVVMHCRGQLAVKANLLWDNDLPT